MDHQRLLKQEKSLRKDMGKQRVKQLKMANEEEDKTISKLEKLLKIDKSKSKKSVPRMFNDGLDYALEMCLPENIEKMYAAAKEAADVEQESDTEWQEDFALATGESKEDININSNARSDKSMKKSKTDDEKADRKLSMDKKLNRLRKIESKYFDESDDNLASDLSDVDSEFENNDGKESVKSENEEFGDDDSDKSDLGEEENFSDEFNDIEENSDSESDEAPEEIKTVSSSSKKRQLEKSSKDESSLKKKAKAIHDECSEDESLENDDFDPSEETEVKGKNARKYETSKQTLKLYFSKKLIFPLHLTVKVIKTKQPTTKLKLDKMNPIQTLTMEVSLAKTKKMMKNRRFGKTFTVERVIKMEMSLLKRHLKRLPLANIFHHI